MSYRFCQFQGSVSFAPENNNPVQRNSVPCTIIYKNYEKEQIDSDAAKLRDVRGFEKASEWRT